MEIWGAERKAEHHHLIQEQVIWNDSINIADSFHAINFKVCARYRKYNMWETYRLAAWFNFSWGFNMKGSAVSIASWYSEANECKSTISQPILVPTKHINKIKLIRKLETNAFAK